MSEVGMLNTSSVIKSSIDSRVEIDWQAYFYSFVEKHGEPVECDGSLLFSDGWGYSNRDYGGPEVPPPENKNKLTRLQRTYWKTQISLLTRKRDDLETRIRLLRNHQESRDLPLKQRVVYQSRNENGDTIETSKIDDIDFGSMQGNLNDVQYLLNDAKNNLKGVQ